MPREQSMSWTHGATLEEREALLDAARSIDRSADPRSRRRNRGGASTAGAHRRSAQERRCVSIDSAAMAGWTRSRSGHPDPVHRRDCEGRRVGWLVRDDRLRQRLRLTRRGTRAGAEDVRRFAMRPRAAARSHPGAARRVAGGYVANGRWPYMSGITHSTWAQFSCRLVDDDGARRSPLHSLRRSCASSFPPAT